MRVLVTGGYGQLGSDVIEELKCKNIECYACGINDFDITNLEQTRTYILKIKPDVIIHCAAYTKVDMAEVEQEICRQINVIGTYNVVMAVKEINAKLLYVSTDYVFSGDKIGLYDINDEPHPINYYGRTKLEGEEIIKKYLTQFFIVRISWLFGKNGVNFVETMLKLASQKSEISVVNDQIGSPTYTKDLARFFSKIIFTEKYGVYHATNEDFCSWAQFAEAIFLEKGYAVKVNYITSEQFAAKASRPKNSKLSKESIINNGFDLFPTWKDALKRYLKK